MTGRSRSPARTQLSRLVAIRTLMDLAGDEEARSLVAEELAVLGVSSDELTVALLDAYDPA